MLYSVNGKRDFDKTHLYLRDLSDHKYQSLINERESASYKHFESVNTFIKYSNNFKDVCERF